MEKVSIKLQGGLGNYLFQISCAYSYAKKHNKQLVLTEDDSVVVHKPINTYKDNILCKIEFSQKENLSTYKRYSEPGFNYNEIPFIDGDVYLASYFQSEKYFIEYEKEIRKLFEYSPELKFEILNKISEKYNDNFNGDTCSIHVRRGDFVNQPQYHPTQNMNYYMKAIKKIGINTKFFVFSDDISWCKENFPSLENFIFIEGQKDYEDLLVMSQCKHNIICNSSFSWWGAWLNENENKIVIAPQNWFGTSYTNYDTRDLYCDNWIKI